MRKPIAPLPAKFLYFMVTVRDMPVQGEDYIEPVEISDKLRSWDSNVVGLSITSATFRSAEAEA